MVLVVLRRPGGCGKTARREDRTSRIITAIFSVVVNGQIAQSVTTQELDPGIVPVRLHGLDYGPDATRGFNMCPVFGR